jgi:molybdate transport system permease protein
LSFAPGELEILVRTLACASLAVALVAAPALALALLLARRRFVGKSLVETLVALPLVAPPVATGLVLLRLLGRRGPIGGPLGDLFGVTLVFNAAAVVAAMAVMALPLFVRTARVAFEGVDPRLEYVAHTLGASRWRVLSTITLPLASRGLGAAALLAWARALGEFGATILVAGAIPGRTETLALAIYQRIQLGHDAEATRFLLLSVALAFVATAVAEALAARRRSAR